jgi:predicted RNase H-like HicB family nuclease
MNEAQLIVAIYPGDDRWCAEHPDVPGLRCYGKTKEEAVVSFMHMLELLVENG